MSKPKIMTPREAQDIVYDVDFKPEICQFCAGVMELWGAHPISPESLVNMHYMLESIFIAGMFFGMENERVTEANR